ncbi:glutathione S-transferase family protein [Agaribacter flavus]|uniref:Glutathione S-transferase family protein n=1 Tax=Agaribacter flavus TaxID=1902781 RepID=A0ABV7FMH3_9ALTE
MIDLYIWRTPNGYKPLIFAEEAGIEYRIHPIDISKGEQFEPRFLDISPNNKIPALIDGSLSIFESGAILLYLAQKFKCFLPSEKSAYYDVLQWLMWQVGGLGPMMGKRQDTV